ncbi:MAG: hypothetical protein ABSB42_09220 [Tepidisphaeraceae bacterium]|jgi:hypothetical protein
MGDDPRPAGLTRPAGFMMGGSPGAKNNRCPQVLSTGPPPSDKMVEKKLIELFFYQTLPALPMVLSLCMENPIKIVLPVLFPQLIF